MYESALSELESDNVALVSKVCELEDELEWHREALKSFKAFVRHIKDPDMPLNASSINWLERFTRVNEFEEYEKQAPVEVFISVHEGSGSLYPCIHARCQEVCTV